MERAGLGAVVHEQDNAFWRTLTFPIDALYAMEKGTDLTALPRHHLVLSKCMKYPCAEKRQASFLAGFLSGLPASGSRRSS